MMVVFLLERVPVSLRGELTRWMLEPRPGVFVGHISAMVREKLWEKACESAKGGACSVIWSSNTEQGFLVETFGDPARKVRNWEGLLLVTRPKKA
jgi:CRISPR-associated protein Cas2